MVEAVTQDAIAAIKALPEDWHGAGSMSPDVIDAMAGLLAEMAPMDLTLETGAGKTTLLFSHFSRRHLVLALDAGESVSSARDSVLLRDGVVEFVEGPTQRTLPELKIDRPLDAALLDGPHGYPFPDLEYFYVYPHIREGGLLFVDDTHIPTVARMFAILRADAMWDMVGVVGKLAILRRTAAEGVSPYEDGWWKQGYNEGLARSLGAPGFPNPTQASDLGHQGRQMLRRVVPRRARLAAKMLIDGPES